jgi:hypothetical protein
MAKWVSLQPSGSRWAVLAFGIAFAMFFVGGSGMLPINPTVHPLLSLVFLWTGIAIFVVTAIVTVFWIVTKPKDAGLNDIKSDLAKIKAKLDIK